MISMFSDLLEMANEQPDPQRLLFLFASAKATNKSKKRDDKRGEISPVMVVDKLPEDLSNFDALVKEADSINKDWDFVVRGVDMDKLEKFLSTLGWVEKLGKTFGVLKFVPSEFKDDKNFESLDIALPRSEISLSQGGYKDFKITFDKDDKFTEDVSDDTNVITDLEKY